MKKIFMTLCAAAALVACSKTEVQYENSAEIGFAPAVMNVTKAAMASGTLELNNPTQKLGVWAYWDNGGSQLELYFSDATFARKTTTLTNGQSVTAWGGDNYAYPWPTNGTLTFAGYTKPTTAITAGYDVANDNVTFTNYSPANGFDLCWFNATTPVNNRASGAAVDVTLSHALSWLTFNIKGEGTVGWKINNIVLNDIAGQGTATCHGTGAGAATWTCSTYTTDVTLLSSELTLTDEFVDIENDAKNILVIPQTINAGGQADAARTQHTLTINYSFPVGTNNWKTDTKVVKLDLTSTDANNPIPNKWESGKHYTYNMTFKSNEILVSPSYGVWGEVQQGVTIE